MAGAPWWVRPWNVRRHRRRDRRGGRRDPGQRAGHRDDGGGSEEGGASAAGQLSDLAPVTSAAAEGVAGPAERVAAVPADDLFAPMRQMALDRQEQFLGVAEGVTAADGAVVALPALLGAEGRARGWWRSRTTPRPGDRGLLSAYAVVSVRNGRLTPQESGTTNDLFNAPAISVAGVPKDTQELWGADQLGRWWGMNLDRHFPYAGLLMHRGSPPGGRRDHHRPAWVAGLLEVTGPISAAGVTVDEDSAEAFFTRDIYAQFPDPTKKDAVTVALIDQMMRKLAGGELNPVALWDALAAPASQGRLLTYSSDAKVQRALERMPTGGRAHRARAVGVGRSERFRRQQDERLSRHLGGVQHRRLLLGSGVVHVDRVHDQRRTG